MIHSELFWCNSFDSTQAARGKKAKREARRRDERRGDKPESIIQRVMQMAVDQRI
jgi:hypothetical protein